MTERVGERIAHDQAWFICQIALPVCGDLAKRVVELAACEVRRFGCSGTELQLSSHATPSNRSTIRLIGRKRFFPHKFLAADPLRRLLTQLVKWPVVS